MRLGFDTGELILLEDMGFKITMVITDHAEGEKDTFYGDYIQNTSDKQIYNILMEKGKYLYQLVSPHEGNDYKWLLMRNLRKSFDRWSICEDEWYFDTDKELLDRLWKKGK